MEKCFGIILGQNCPWIFVALSDLRRQMNGQQVPTAVNPPLPSGKMDGSNNY